MRTTPGPIDRNDTLRDVAREARTALNDINGYVELLAEDISNQEMVSDLSRIRTASNRVMELVQDLERQADSARELANRDPLTGIANRRTLMARGEALLARDAVLSVLVIDVDKFKDVNDRYGHLVGDEVLKIVVERCRRAVRDSDFVARFAGDEFVILLPNTADAEAHIVAARVLNHVITAPFATSAGEVPVTVSVGVATRVDETHLDELMAKADQAMYRAKNVDPRSRPRA